MTPFDIIGLQAEPLVAARFSLGISPAAATTFDLSGQPARAQTLGRLAYTGGAGTMTSLKIAGIEANMSRNAMPLSAFVTDAGTIRENFLGVPIFPGQQVRAQGTLNAAGLASLEFNGATLPRDAPVVSPEQLGPMNWFFGLGGTTVVAGGTATLVGTANRVVMGDIGRLVLDFDPGLNNACELRVVDIEIQNVSIDNDTDNQPVAAERYLAQNLGQVGEGFEASLPLGGTITVTLENVGLVDVPITGGFMRSPDYSTLAGDYAGHQLMASLPAETGGVLVGRRPRPAGRLDQALGVGMRLSEEEGRLAERVGLNTRELAELDPESRALVLAGATKGLSHGMRKASQRRRK